jgi:hypothetical protein
LGICGDRKYSHANDSISQNGMPSRWLRKKQRSTIDS